MTELIAAMFFVGINVLCWALVRHDRRGRSARGGTTVSAAPPGGRR